MPLFVQEIWTILINFLLRAKHESLVISKIFEDIAKCLFDRNLYENSLVCFIISVLSGTKSPNLEILEKIDYLLAWFAKKKSFDTINFASIHILNVFYDKFSAIQSGSVMWRCQFTRLIYAQFLHDLGTFDEEALNRMHEALEYSKKTSNCGFSSLLVEESSILEARNLVKIYDIKPTPKVEHSESRFSSNVIENPSKFSPKSITFNPVLEPLPNSFNSLDLGNQESAPSVGNLETLPLTTNNYASLDKDDLISNSIPLSPVNIYPYNSSSTEMAAENPKSPSSNTEKISDSKEKSSDTGANVLVKLKSWLPISKSGASNQENQKQITKANMGKPNSFRYDEKLKKWVDDNDPSTSEQAPKLPPPPAISVAPSNHQTGNSNGPINFRAKKGKVKYFDPLNPDGPSSTQLQPSVPNFD